MDKKIVLSLLDAEIERLQQARELLSTSNGQNRLSISRRGGKRQMSAAARRKISEAQKKRWALRKRAAKS